MEDRVVRIPVQIGNETREVDFLVQTFSEFSRGYSAHVFAARIGNGSKVHRASATASIWKSVAEARKYAAGSKVYEVDGLVITIPTLTIVHNKHARIVGFAEHFEGSVVASKWSSVANLKEVK